MSGLVSHRCQLHPQLVFWDCFVSDKNLNLGWQQQIDKLNNFLSCWKSCFCVVQCLRALCVWIVWLFCLATVWILHSVKCLDFASDCNKDFIVSKCPFGSDLGEKRGNSTKQTFIMMGWMTTCHMPRGSQFWTALLWRLHPHWRGTMV